MYAKLRAFTALLGLQRKHFYTQNHFVRFTQPMSVDGANKFRNLGIFNSNLCKEIAAKM